MFSRSFSSFSKLGRRVSWELGVDYEMVTVGVMEKCYKRERKLSKENHANRQRKGEWIVGAHAWCQSG
jgi:hypothetical protein